MSDAAQTAEFDYIEDFGDDSDASEEVAAPAAGSNSKSSTKKKQTNDASDGGGPITRALEDFDASLNPNDDSRSGAFGFDQPQVSGVFSRYEEETEEADADDFDLFDDKDGDEPRERTLQEIVSAHEKQMRRLQKRLSYQKEVIQVVSELLVEARVVSKRELKKRLRALRDKK